MMQPQLNTPSELQYLLEIIKPFEPLVYVANAGANRAFFEALLAPDFWEIGASGKRYSREYVLGELEKRQQNPYSQAWHTTDHYLQKIANQLYLYTYTLHQPTRVSQRTSLWHKTETSLQLLYHQGTVV